MLEREIEIRRDPFGVVVFSFRGNMDEHDELYGVVEQAKEHRLDRVIIDLSGVEFGGGAFKGILVHLWKQATEANGRVAFVKAPKAFHRQLEISELTEHFDIFEDEAAARAGLGLI